MKKLYLTLILVAVLTLSFAQVPTAYSAELTAPDKALLFLRDVVNLDMTKYTATLDGHSVDYPAEFGGITQEDITYILESNENKLVAAFTFRNKTLAWCAIDLLEGSPPYAQPSTSILDMAKDILQRYQTYTGDPDFEETRNFTGMRNILDTVDVIKNTTTTLDNVKLKITSGTDYTVFEWIYTSNGLDFPGITIEFLNGSFFGLSDIWSIYKIGSTDVNVSKEEAVNIALKYVENFSWNVSTSDDDWIEVKDFKILEEPLTAELLTTRTREPLTLYPYWRVDLYLDKVYLGNVNRISLAIWADTGDVASCLPLGRGGGPLTGVSTTNLQSDGSTSQANPTPIIIAVSVVIVIAAIAAVFIRKKCKQPTLFLYKSVICQPFHKKQIGKYEYISKFLNKR
jgi:hypothetical protein